MRNRVQYRSTGSIPFDTLPDGRSRVVLTYTDTAKVANESVYKPCE